MRMNMNYASCHSAATKKDLEFRFHSYGALEVIPAVLMRTDTSI